VSCGFSSGAPSSLSWAFVGLGCDLRSESGSDEERELVDPVAQVTARVHGRFIHGLVPADVARGDPLGARSSFSRLRSGAGRWRRATLPSTAKGHRREPSGR
jgi:hypothetical protein